MIIGEKDNVHFNNFLKCRVPNFLCDLCGQGKGNLTYIFRNLLFTVIELAKSVQNFISPGEMNVNILNQSIIANIMK